jgi:hypothetical protein
VLRSAAERGDRPHGRRARRKQIKSIERNNK